jgi:deazaflavin-dependent oxidoreductase (nitroreductase family)
VAASTSTVPPVWRQQGRVRDWFHTKAGAKFLNLQTAWFRIAAPKGYAVLSTVGRRTGRPRRSNVRAIVRGDRAFVVSIAGRANDWFHNLHAKPEASLRIGRRDWIGRARQPRDDGERHAARAAYCETVNWFDRISSLVNQQGIPSRQRIRAMHTRWIDEGELFVIELIGAECSATPSSLNRGRSRG